MGLLAGLGNILGGVGNVIGGTVKAAGTVVASIPKTAATVGNWMTVNGPGLAATAGTVKGFIDAFGGTQGAPQPQQPYQQQTPGYFQPIVVQGTGTPEYSGVPMVASMTANSPAPKEQVAGAGMDMIIPLALVALVVLVVMKK